MKNKVSFWPIMGSILIILITGYLGYILITTLTKYIQLVSPNIAVAVIAGLVTVFGYFITRNFERKKIIEQQIREKKLPVYEEFVSFLFNVIIGAKNDQPVSQGEMEKFMIEFNKKSIVWLSDNSLKGFVKWKNSAANLDSKDSGKVLENLYLLEDLFFEFRKDIGHNNKDLKKGDLLSLFINDLDKYHP